MIFADTLEILLIARDTFETVRLFEDEKFDKLGIIEGVGISIRSQVTHFKRAKAAG